MKFIIAVAAVLAIAVAAPQTDLLSDTTATVDLGAPVGTVLGDVLGITGIVDGAITVFNQLIVGTVVSMAGAAFCTIVSVAGAPGCLVGNMIYTLASVKDGGRCTFEVAGCGVIITDHNLLNDVSSVQITSEGLIVGIFHQAIRTLREAIADVLENFVVAETDHYIWQDAVCIWSSGLHQFKLMSNSLADAYTLAGGDRECDITEQLNFQARLQGTGASANLDFEIIKDLECIISEVLQRTTSMIDGVASVVGADCSAFYVQQ